MMRPLLLITMFLLPTAGMSQDFELDTQEVLDVIKKWNFAVNARSEQTLHELYADRVIYYAKDISRDKCVAAKRSFFAANPAFRQKIVTDPKFAAHTAGVVKSTFIREVFQKGKWKKVPTYLLISYEKNKYKITGESEPGTDQAANYELEIGEPMEIPQSDPVSQSTRVPDTRTQLTDSTHVAQVDSIDNQLTEKLEDSTVISAVTKEMLSDETVAVPKKYVYILIGLLVLVAAIAVFAKRPRKSASKPRKQNDNDRETTGLRNDKIFESFVVALFDPHYFALKNLSRQRVYAGNTQGADFTPTLELEFQNKDTKATIAIECIFIPQLTSRQILSYSANQINRYHDFEDGTGMEVYIVIGLEGDANDPKEVFLIPITELREGNLGYPDLQPFRKHGMFFYNSVKRRLL